MQIQIQSVQIGRVLTEGNPETRDVLERQWTTAFYKTPIHGPVSAGLLGLHGDAVADTKNHGGVDKAILCYASSHYELWAEERPQLNMSPGAFGENLTLTGIDEDSVCIGDRYTMGDSEVEVSQPRQPCWKIARRWGDKSLTKRVTQTGRTGWYLRVTKPGTIEAGQGCRLAARPHENWTIKRANDVMFGRGKDRVEVIELMNLPELAEAWRSDIA